MKTGTLKNWLASYENCVLRFFCYLYFKIPKENNSNFINKNTNYGSKKLSHHTQIGGSKLRNILVLLFCKNIMKFLHENANYNRNWLSS